MNKPNQTLKWGLITGAISTIIFAPLFLFVGVIWATGFLIVHNLKIEKGLVILFFAIVAWLCGFLLAGSMGDGPHSIPSPLEMIIIGLLSSGIVCFSVLLVLPVTAAHNLLFALITCSVSSLLIADDGLGFLLGFMGYQGVLSYFLSRAMEDGRVNPDK